MNIINNPSEKIMKARRSENFLDYLREQQDWIENFHGEGKPFNRFFFIRNPLHATNCYDNTFTDSVDEKYSSTGNQDIVKLKEIFRNNEETKKYLGKNIDTIFDECFTPGKNGGVDCLATNILNDFNDNPDIKKNVLEENKKNIIDQISNLHSMYIPMDEDDAHKAEKKAAIKFLQKLRKNRETITILINSFLSRYPDETKLFAKYREIVDDSDGDIMMAPMTTQMTYHKLVENFIDLWAKESAGLEIKS